MTVIVNPVDEKMEAMFPVLVKDFKEHGVVATITLFSKDARARSGVQVYSMADGQHNYFYGSRALYERWVSEGCRMEDYE